MYVCRESMNSKRLAFGFPEALEKKLLEESDGGLYCTFSAAGEDR